jgi:SAM-dependent methyltransferase
VGGGTGPLARELGGHGIQVVVADLAGGLLSQAPRPAVRTDARAAGFQAGSFGTVLAFWMLYHLPEPAVALVEVRRVLRPGGTFAACAPSRENDDVRRYLRGRGLTEAAAGRAAAQVAAPVRLTKRGTLIWARAAA